MKIIVLLSAILLSSGTLFAQTYKRGKRAKGENVEYKVKSDDLFIIVNNVENKDRSRRRCPYFYDVPIDEMTEQVCLIVNKYLSYDEVLSCNKYEMELNVVPRIDKNYKVFQVTFHMDEDNDFWINFPPDRLYEIEKNIIDSLTIAECSRDERYVHQYDFAIPVHHQTLLQMKEGKYKKFVIEPSNWLKDMRALNQRYNTGEPRNYNYGYDITVNDITYSVSPVGSINSNNEHIALVSLSNTGRKFWETFVSGLRSPDILAMDTVALENILHKHLYPYLKASPKISSYLERKQHDGLGILELFPTVDKDKKLIGMEFTFNDSPEWQAIPPETFYAIEKEIQEKIEIEPVLLKRRNVRPVLPRREKMRPFYFWLFFNFKSENNQSDGE